MVSVPPATSVAEVRAAARHCHGCPLWERATQTVFGEGPPGAPLMLVGDRALADAGISRDDVYVTNAVKHFKWEERGRRRLHKKPNAAEVSACHPWLDAEVALVDPRVVVAMGATATASILGPRARVTRDRGQPLEWRARVVVVTVHPSAILRMQDGGDREGEFRRFVADLVTAGRVGMSAARGG